MNASFRRDYAYVTKADINLKVTGLLEKGTHLRYIKYDSRTKSYLFVTGHTYRHDEKLIVVGFVELDIMFRYLKKIHRCGYEHTDEYDYKLITNSRQLVLGSRYNFTVINRSASYIAKETLELRSLVPKGSSNLSYASTGTGSQNLPQQWLSTGHVLGLLVG